MSKHKAHYICLKCLKGQTKDFVVYSDYYEIPKVICCGHPASVRFDVNFMDLGSENKKEKDE